MVSVDGGIHMLDHAGQDTARRHIVLILVYANRIKARALFPRRLDHAQTGLARRRENDVGARAELLRGLAFALALVVPVARIRGFDLRGGVQSRRFRARHVARLKFLDERYLFAAHKPYGMRFAHGRGQKARQKRALLLFELQCGAVLPPLRARSRPR